jgi:hypothetical protein
MTNTLEKLKANLSTSNYPVNYPHFGGAGLIITNNPARNSHEGDLVVCTEHAGAISWLIIQLKGIYEYALDYSNKYEFYQSVGQFANEAIQSGHSLPEILQTITEKVTDTWPIQTTSKTMESSNQHPQP